MKKLLSLLFLANLLFAKSEMLEIDSLDFKGDDKKGTATFTGNVKIKMGQDRLNANKVDVFFENDKDGNKTPLKYEAIGNADFIIVTEDKHYEGSGDKVIYNPRKEEYTIIGNGYIFEKKDNKKVYGDTIYVNQLTGESKVKGDENKPVKFLINVERGEKK